MNVSDRRGTHHEGENPTRSLRLLTSSKNRPSKESSDYEDWSSDSEEWSDQSDNFPPLEEQPMDVNFGGNGQPTGRRAMFLTPREQQVLELLSQGYTNRCLVTTAIRGDGREGLELNEPERHASIHL